MSGSIGLRLFPEAAKCACVQSEPRIQLPSDKAKALMERIQNAGTEVVEAKVSLLLKYAC